MARRVLNGRKWRFRARAVGQIAADNFVDVDDLMRLNARRLQVAGFSPVQLGLNR
jgi:hypothetical protein